MRRLALLFLSLACALTLSTAVVACGGDDDGTVDGGAGGNDAGSGGAADAAPGGGEADAGGGDEDAGVLQR
jgi:hypothetical protein